MDVKEIDGRAEVSWSEVDAWLEWSNLNWSAEELWKAHIRLTQAEAGFRIAKSDLAIRPIWHQKAERARPYPGMLSGIRHLEDAGADVPGGGSGRRAEEGLRRDRADTDGGCHPSDKGRPQHPPQVRRLADKVSGNTAPEARPDAAHTPQNA